MPFTHASQREFSVDRFASRAQIAPRGTPLICETLGPSPARDEGLQKYYTAFDMMDLSTRRSTVVVPLVSTPPVARGRTAAASHFRQYQADCRPSAAKPPRATKPSAGIFRCPQD